MLPAYLFATRVLKPGNDDMHHAGLRGSERSVENANAFQKTANIFTRPLVMRKHKGRSNVEESCHAAAVSVNSLKPHWSVAEKLQGQPVTYM